MLRTSITLLACCKEQSSTYSFSPSSSELGSSEVLASCSFRYTTKARLARNIGSNLSLYSNGDENSKNDDEKNIYFSLR